MITTSRDCPLWALKGVNPRERIIKSRIRRNPARRKMMIVAGNHADN